MQLHPHIGHSDLFRSGTNAAKLYLWGFSYPVKIHDVEFLGGKRAKKSSVLGGRMLCCVLPAGDAQLSAFVLRAVSFSFKFWLKLFLDKYLLPTVVLGAFERI